MDRGHTRRAFVVTGAALGVQAALGRLWTPTPTAGAVTEPVDLCAAIGADPYRNTTAAIGELGGMGRFVGRGATVGLLVNHQFRNPGAHVHPGVALAVAVLAWEAGAKAVLSLKDQRFTYWPREGKYADAVRRMTSCSGTYVTIPLPRGQTLKKADVIKELRAVDVLINVSVAKHHDGTGFACVLKNAMGAVTYTTCQFFHFGHGKGGWYGDVEFLSQCVADLNALRPPDLAVADATTILTSSGPFGPGTLAKPHTVVAGVNAVSVDAHCTRFLGLDPTQVSMVARSAALGVGEADLTKVRTREVRI